MLVTERKKLVVIGDVHGRTTWKQIVEEPADMYVFLGDYVSTHDNITAFQQFLTFVEIIRFKLFNKDKVVLCIGNHDTQHLGYHWAECSGFFRKVTEYLFMPINDADTFCNLTPLTLDIIPNKYGTNKKCSNYKEIFEAVSQWCYLDYDFINLFYMNAKDIEYKIDYMFGDIVTDKRNVVKNGANTTVDILEIAANNGLNNKIGILEGFDYNNNKYYYLDKYTPTLFSHAGISKSWLHKHDYNNNPNIDINSLAIDEVSINSMHISDPLCGPKFAFTANHFSDYSGTSASQPLTWIRPWTLVGSDPEYKKVTVERDGVEIEEEIAMAYSNREQIDGYDYVVGHTPVETITNIKESQPLMKNNLYLCDTALKTFLIIEYDFTFVRVINEYLRYTRILYLSDSTIKKRYCTHTT